MTPTDHMIKTMEYLMRPRRLLKALGFALITSIAHAPLQAAAQTPTPAQIEQFKRLSPSEQEALAKSMGISLSDIAGFTSKQTTPPSPRESVSGKRNPKADKNKTNNEDELEKISEEGTDTPTLNEDEAPESTEERLRLYGYDIFRFGAETFTPASDIPVPASYVLGPGDTIHIQMYGKENATHILSLNREGQIQFPNIGPISLAGISFTDAKNKISEIVSEQMIGVKSSVTMGELRTIRIFVLGEAQVPGSYVVGSLSTMTNAIFASGGVTKIGSLRRIQLKRAGKIITELDLYDLLLQGDTSQDSRLLPGDVIFVPPIGKTVGLSGQVKRPAIYELKNEDSVYSALALAGGLLPTAFVPASRIERITKTGEKTLVNLDLSTTKGRNFKIQDADVVQIFSTLDTMRDIVKLEGHVKRPGGFAWREDMRFTDIVPNVDDLLANPDIEIGLIQREQKNTRKIEVRLFSPQKAFENPEGYENPKLNPRDSVILFDYTSDRTEILAELMENLKIQSNFLVRQQIVQIYGSVRFPGEYPLANESMSAFDLINLAGGLTESALGSGAEITRYDLDEDRKRIVLHVDVNLETQNPELIAGDTLRIKQIPLWKKRESVVLTGEVIYPGTYDILPGETLLDVIGRAGGLTPHAYPEGAIFSREELRLLEQERLNNLREKIEGDIVAAKLEQSTTGKDIDENETSQILENIDQVEALGRMVIDLPAILKSPQNFDFGLAGGDTIEIPRLKPSVTVVGEIQHPTSHFYNQKLSVKDYIQRSGGTKRNADQKRIYVVKANGRVYSPSTSAWFRSKSKALEPGDTIIVPIDTDRVDALTMWSSIASILGQSAAFIAVVTN